MSADTDSSPSLRFPAYGEQKAIVILVEYQDVKFSDRYNAADYFTRMLNEDGFSDYNATGCAVSISVSIPETLSVRSLMCSVR